MLSPRCRQRRPVNGGDEGAQAFADHGVTSAMTMRVTRLFPYGTPRWPSPIRTLAGCTPLGVFRTTDPWCVLRTTDRLRHSVGEQEVACRRACFVDELES